MHRFDYTKQFNMTDVNEFLNTMLFIMRSELLFTNNLIPKCFALLETKDPDVCATAMRQLRQSDENPFVSSHEEGLKKFIEDEELKQIIFEFRMKALDEDHKIIALYIIETYDTTNGTYVFTKLENLEKKSNPIISTHFIEKGQSVVTDEGEIAEKRREITFNKNKTITI